MAVGFKVKYFWFQVGTGDFLHAFFSTVCYNLEGKNWGSKYPFLMKNLYNGEIEYKDIGNAIKELNEIKKGLVKYSPDKIVWDINDLSVKPPWGDNLSTDITDLSNYFITSEGEDLFLIIQHALEKAIDLKASIKVENI